MESEQKSTLPDARTWLAVLAALLGVYAALRTARLARRSAPTSQTSEHKPRVVVLGGGFAGLEAARTLQRLLPGRCETVLIDRHNYQLFTPLLFQVATCGVDPYSITYPLRHFAEHRGITFRTGNIRKIDLDRRRIKAEGGELGYDYLVIALGSSADFGTSKSAPEHALPLKSIVDGIAVRNHVIDMLERGAQASDPRERQSLITFAIVGGGATGVETAAALAELLNHTVPSAYPGIRREEPKVVLLEAGGKLLGNMKEPVPARALQRLLQMGVEVRFDSRVRDAGPDRLTMDSGIALEARTIVWATGVKAPRVVGALAAQHGEGGSLLVDRYLQVRGRPGVYAVGDSADISDELTGERVPWLAAAAIQEGRAAAENIARLIEGRPQNPFQFRNPGSLISLGRSDGLAQFGRLVLGGAPGALAWHGVHLFKIPTLRERISTALDWSAGYVHDKDTSRLDVTVVSSRPETDTAESGTRGDGEQG